jgi:hypothetical protein
VAGVDLSIQLIVEETGVPEVEVQDILALQALVAMALLTRDTMEVKETRGARSVGAVAAVLVLQATLEAQVQPMVMEAMELLLIF